MPERNAKVNNMALKDKFWERIEKTPPIIYTLGGWEITLSFSAIISAEWMNDAVGIPLLLVALFLIIMLPTLSIVYATKLYEIDRWYLLKVIQLFVVLALVFANIFYLLIAMLDPTQIYEGIHNPWEWLGGSQGRRMYWENIWKAAVDCIYYSFATTTTSAYGDIKPTIWYTKLLANLEVLLGVGLVSIGVGRYFSNDKKSHEKYQK